MRATQADVTRIMLMVASGETNELELANWVDRVLERRAG